MTAIETRGLSKIYGKKAAVSELDLAIQAGEFFALLGLNGAGKTTTIRMLTCLTRPTGGDALILGRSVIREPEAVRKCANISPQETAVAPNLTVRENLMLIAQIYGMSRAQAARRTDEITQQLSLDEIVKSRAKTLSGGWQRRLSLAMALITQPKVLYLDEPTLGLDILARRELWRAMEDLKGRVTVVLTTHYLEEAEALADRIGIMANGRLKAVGTAAEIKSAARSDNFEDAFLALAQGGGTV
ncbi:ABC transporter ATP-binding protein [Feifania hominis]|uniref:ABC transporter ATP-binding protein n=1 Tax=Feifania hominis TaxID=2763660 RepID=A0A926DDJ9_9FIRM|nr:ABC transporter ATP-binding protein [Feifania hominis]MBC8535824.1 ABC transporter ATP-binding protein [Feifania hominis]